jgi:hypothetical protein
MRPIVHSNSIEIVAQARTLSSFSNPSQFPATALSDFNSFVKKPVHFPQAFPRNSETMRPPANCTPCDAYPPQQRM